MQRILNRLPVFQQKNKNKIWTNNYHTETFVCPHQTSLLTVDLQDVFGSSSVVELVDVLRDDGDLAPLFAQTLLTLSDGQVSGIGIFCEHDLTPVVVELPNTWGISGKGLRRGQFLTVLNCAIRFLSWPMILSEIFLKTQNKAWELVVLDQQL